MCMANYITQHSVIYFQCFDECFAANCTCYIFIISPLYPTDDHFLRHTKHVEAYHLAHAIMETGVAFFCSLYLRSGLGVYTLILYR